LFNIYGPSSSVSLHLVNAFISVEAEILIERIAQCYENCQLGQYNFYNHPRFSLREEYYPASLVKDQNELKKLNLQEGMAIGTILVDVYSAGSSGARNNVALNDDNYICFIDGHTYENDVDPFNCNNLLHNNENKSHQLSYFIK
jgi:hypothetical protein